MNVTETSNAVHPFTAAGLGLAPFTLLRCETSADRESLNRERESNGLQFTTNYCTSCDYCGTAIQNAFRLRSADGKEFKVGADCVEKTNDAKLVKIVKKQVSEATKARKRARQLAARAELWAMVAANADRLAGMPHPDSRMAADGRTLADYAEFIKRCGGATSEAALLKRLRSQLS